MEGTMVRLGHLGAVALTLLALGKYRCGRVQEADHRP